MSCSPTGCLVRALSRRSTRSRTSMKTGKLNSVHITLTPCVINMLTFSCSYLLSWNKLTDRFFKTSPWPEAEAIASLVGNGESVIHYLFYFWFCMDSIIFILYCLSVIFKKKDKLAPLKIIIIYFIYLRFYKSFRPPLCGSVEMFHVVFVSCVLQMPCFSFSTKNSITDTSTLKSAWVAAKYEQSSVSFLSLSKKLSRIWLEKNIFCIIRVDQLWTRDLSPTTITATSSTTFSVRSTYCPYIFSDPLVQEQQLYEIIVDSKQMLMGRPHWSCQTSGSGTSSMSLSTRYITVFLECMLNNQ